MFGGYGSYDWTNPAKEISSRIQLKNPNNPKMNLRKLTSLILAWSFVILAVTSIVLYIVPSGRVAFWANWTLLGLDKHGWGALHTNVGYLFLAASGIHIVLNWKLIVNYIKKKAKESARMNKDMVWSIVIVLFFSVFTIADLPPVNWIQVFGEGLKEGSEVKFGSPPYGHAEMSSLQLYCTRTALNVEDAVQALDKAGVEISGVDQSIADIAEANNMTPQQIAEIITPKEVLGTTLTGGGSFSGGFGTGKRFGHMPLKEAAEVSGQPIEDLQAILNEAGYPTDPEKTIKEIAASKGHHPSEVVLKLGLESEAH
jgi:hypothetical protein